MGRVGTLQTCHGPEARAAEPHVCGGGPSSSPCGPSAQGLSSEALDGMRERGFGREAPRISAHSAPWAYSYLNLLATQGPFRDPRLGVKEPPLGPAGPSVGAAPLPDSLTNFADPHPPARLLWPSPVPHMSMFPRTRGTERRDRLWLSFSEARFPHLWNGNSSCTVKAIKRVQTCVLVCKR